VATYGSWLDGQGAREDDGGWIARAWLAAGPKGTDGRANTRPRKYSVKSVEEWVRETLTATLDQGTPGRTDAALAILKAAYSGGLAHVTATAPPDAAEAETPAEAASWPGQYGVCAAHDTPWQRVQLADGPLFLWCPAGSHRADAALAPPSEVAQPDEPSSAEPAGSPCVLTGDSGADIERITRAAAAEQGIDYDNAMAGVHADGAPPWVIAMTAQLDVMTALIGVIGQNTVPSWTESVSGILAEFAEEPAKPQGLAEQAAELFMPPAPPIALAAPDGPPTVEELAAGWEGSS
jgi:hypothetical protein